MCDFSSVSIYELLNHIARVNFLRNHDVFEQYGLYPGQPRLLIALEKEDGQSQAALCHHLHIKPSTLTVMIRRMIKHDLVDKQSDATDKRMTRIYLTPKGRDLCTKLRHIHDVSNTLCTQHMTQEEQLIFKRLLRQVLENFQEDLSQKGGDFPC